MKRLKFTLKAWPVVAVATIGMCYLTQLVAGWFGVTLPGQEQIATVKSRLGWNLDFAIICLQVLVLVPVVEEFVFRYLLWKLPGPRRVWIMAVFSSAIFSVAHYPDYRASFKTGAFSWLPLSDAFLALFFFGLAQCWLYRKTDRLWCPMLNHALFNLTNLVLLFFLPEGA